MLACPKAGSRGDPIYELESLIRGLIGTWGPGVVVGVPVLAAALGLLLPLADQRRK